MLSRNKTISPSPLVRRSIHESENALTEVPYWLPIPHPLISFLLCILVVHRGVSRSSSRGYVNAGQLGMFHSVEQAFWNLDPKIHDGFHRLPKNSR